MFAMVFWPDHRHRGLGVVGVHVPGHGWRETGDRIRRSLLVGLAPQNKALKHANMLETFINS